MNIPCGVMTQQLVPTKWDYKEIPIKCGHTGIDGDPVYCADCYDAIDKRGFKPYECRHGVDMRPEGFFCNQCEYGD